ncbi:MAG: hypothetical protein NWF14_05445 [Candidatus Bathyarchaeota archaeon]|nr:hypothetical protein [Candidatus Bathyarchaeota archaeon]
MKKGETESPRSYTLRITREEWFQQVFMIKKYYPGVPRRWEPDGVILLVRKAEKGDSFVGYGTVERFVKRDHLPEEKRKECEKMGWKGAIVFSELYKFDPPLPIKETVLKDPRLKGRIFHGYPLTKEQVDSVLDTAKENVTFRKID